MQLVFLTANSSNLTSHGIVINPQNRASEAVHTLEHFTLNCLKTLVVCGFAFVTSDKSRCHALYRKFANVSIGICSYIFFSIYLCGFGLSKKVLERF